MTGTRKRICAALCALVLLLAAGIAGAEQQVKLNTVQKALAYVDENHPTELDLGSVRMSPQELWSIRQRMPEGAVLHFSTQWGGVTITDRDQELNLNKTRKGVNGDTISKLIDLMPELKKVDVSEHRSIPLEVMGGLADKHPDIQFVFYIVLNRHHSLLSHHSAYSSFNEPTEPIKLTSKQLENLRYAPGIKALDLGHNKITSLEFLRYFPDIEFLILGDNQISDLEPLGSLKHLKYLEMFSVPVTDITPLGNCRELLDLNLSYCHGVTDLSPLDQVTSLERFWGNHMNGLTAEQKAHFIETHPQTETVFEGQHATSDGWRIHDRFQHYRWCLHHHVWIPFDQPLP